MCPPVALLSASECRAALLELMTAWIVILWRFAAIYVCAKHIRADTGAEMLNSNRLPVPEACLEAAGRMVLLKRKCRTGWYGR